MPSYIFHKNYIAALPFVKISMQETIHIEYTSILNHIATDLDRSSEMKMEYIILKFIVSLGIFLESVLLVVEKVI